MKYKRLIIAGVSTLCILIIFATIQSAKNIGKLPITINVTPDDSQLVIDKKIKVKAGDLRLKPGNHVVTMSRPGFASQTSHIVVSKNSLSFRFALHPNSLEGAQWLEQHSAQAREGEAVSSQQFDKNVDSSIAVTPLIKYLPFIDNEYRIDYGASIQKPNDPSASAIIISSSSENGKQDALSWIRFKGYDPATLEIIYRSL